MNGSLIFAVIQLITALECVEVEDLNLANNDTSIERQVIVQNGTDEDTTGVALSGLVRLLKKQCPCPCSGVPHVPVCGRTTNGIARSFDSQCHLICHNQCGSVERYAVVSHGPCPVVHTFSPIISNRRNIYSAPYEFENRRTDGAMAMTSNAYTSISALDWQCDCSYCPETRWIRLDYYPICGERAGQKVTFDSWCHFDCENKCIRHTGRTYLYQNKGPCELERNNEVVIPRTFETSGTEACESCNLRCKDFFEPVCAKNYKDEFLSFKSRCHLRCYNQCHHPRDSKEDFVHIFDGQCPWI